MSTSEERATRRGGKGDHVSFQAILSVQLLASVFYLGMEWLFFATKASFMSSFTSVEKWGALLIPPVALSLAVLPLILLLGVIDLRLPKLHARCVVPAFFLASTLFLLIDNFLYTVFRVGVITSGSVLRFSYLALFLYLLLRSLGWSRSMAQRWDSLSRRHPLRALPAVIVIGALVAIGAEVVTTDFSRAAPELQATNGEIRRPNIILLSSDGVEARLMSVYGFQFPTTPFLEKFAGRALVFENAFPNSGKTTGTLSSMLSGSLPSELHVGFPPHIFPKQHAALHLPGVLQKLGYKGYQRSVRYYADAGDLNMINSFDVANGRRLWTPAPGSVAGRLAYLFSAEVQFSTRMTNRLAERLLHIFGIKPIINHYLLVKEGASEGLKVDRQTLEDALGFAHGQEGPYFMQIHLMGTHCCGYVEARRWFDPADMPAPPPEDRDREIRYLGARQRLARYLDSIRDADDQIQTFVEQLEATGELENTILVIASDHSQMWRSDQRVPLIVYFPDELYRGRIERNVSLAQVPATILEYMGVERPGWMTQGSLLSELPPRDPLEAAMTVAGNPPILSLASFYYTRFKLPGGGLGRIDRPGPPLFGVREVGLILGPYWKKMDVGSGVIGSGSVSQHTAVENPALLPSDSEVREYIVRHLEESGFSLPFSVTSEP